MFLLESYRQEKQMLLPMPCTQALLRLESSGITKAVSRVFIHILTYDIMKYRFGGY